jgi:hypothetical protein
MTKEKPHNDDDDDRPERQTTEKHPMTRWQVIQKKTNTEKN